MQDILDNYPWMIYTLAICSLCLIIFILLSILKKDNKDENVASEETDFVNSPVVINSDEMINNEENERLNEDEVNPK